MSTCMGSANLIEYAVLKCFTDIYIKNMDFNIVQLKY